MTDAETTPYGWLEPETGNFCAHADKLRLPHDARTFTLAIYTEPPARDKRSEWHGRYIGQMVSRGVALEFAIATCEAGYEDHQYDESPEDAADEEMSYWDNDESLEAPNA